CTSWTFFGAVGSAVTNGWLFITIYLGPVLVFILGHRLLRKMLELTQRLRLTSIADFIAYRYGKSRGIAGLVTITAVLGSLPYFALQLHAITSGLMIISEPDGGISEPTVALLLALAMGLFAILFGARRLDVSEHHPGMVMAVAFESLVKLLAFSAVGLFALFVLLDGPIGMIETVANDSAYRSLFAGGGLPSGFIIQTLLAAAAIVCLPRQFQLTLVENKQSADLLAARWLFPTYLMVFALLVVPIAVAGLEAFGGSEAAVEGDAFVLSLPMLAESRMLTMLAFMGGFSAATGMVIVATVALATMVSNDLIMPLLLRHRRLSTNSDETTARQQPQNFDVLLLLIRRCTILALVVIAWVYYLLIDETAALAAIGLVSFSAAAQFAPALLLGLYWPAASRMGAATGLLIGLVGWLALIVVPAVLPTLDPWVHWNVHLASWITLGLNTLTIVLVSLWTRRRRPLPTRVLAADGHRVTVGELRRFAAGFIGQARVDEAFSSALQPADGLGERDDDRAEPELVGFTERLLAGCIGSASARAVLSSGLQRTGLNSAQAQALLEQTSSAIQFNRDLLEATLDHIAQGVSVVDADLRLVSWNQAYLELFEYPPNVVYVGRPVEELIRFNLERGLAGEGSIEEGVDRRMHHMRRGLPYVFERAYPNGRVIEIRGNPMPKKGYVTTYTDITRYKQTEHELKQSYATMEQQVESRTAELSQAMRALSSAKAEAEQANRSKSRFLAAASHDLLQPMNAARLFASTLRQNSEAMSDESAALVRRVDHSLTSAETLLSSLLDISRLDQDALQPQWSEFPINELLDTLERQFEPLAQRRGLSFKVRRADWVVRSDQKMLQRILFNLVTNAMRYTNRGGVLVGCRTRGGRIAVQVYDTGPGIPESEQSRIFEEFHRLEQSDRVDSEFDSGLGLGLAICQRMSRALDSQLSLRSVVGQGSQFSVDVMLAAHQQQPPATEPMRSARTPSRMHGLTVLCVDDDRDILDGMRGLLERWGCRVRTASDREQACNHVEPPPDLLMIDYHLADGDDGLSVAQALLERTEQPFPVLVLTADRSDALGQAIEARDYHRLTKPIKPAALRALMRHVLER
ncbi:MAG: PAS domain-containing hybrid sensor histidine kinase/response regulator, partial [Pseudomonadota bacterium]